MGYLIRYAGKTPAVSNHQGSGWAAAFFCAILVGLAALKWLYPEFDSLMQQVIFPGAEENTAVLLEQTLSGIREGRPIVESLQTFCSEVIANGAY